MPRSAAIKLPRRPSLAVWAILGVLAIVFSYLFNLAIAACCIVLPFLSVMRGLGGAQAVFLLIFGLVMGFTIVWSLVPRRSRFEIPGVLLPLSRHPRLQRRIQEIADALGQKLPQELYLIPEANAWVRERGGGLLRFRRERVMALGLPLLACLSVSQLRAVLAHEFGHFYAGDTRLGPKVYAARAAMVRTLLNLSSDSVVWDILSRFGLAALARQLVLAGLVGYWKLFMRLTQLISRRQEFRSDELACHVAGKEAMIAGLQKVEVASVAIPHFWRTVMNPVLAGGYRPPLADGFVRFLRAPDIEKANGRYLEAALRESKTNAYDTHPALKDRIEKIRSLRTATPAQEDDSPATDLIEDLDLLETKLLQTMAPELPTETLKAMNWETAASSVYGPIWKSWAATYAHVLDGITVAGIPDLLQNLSPLGARIRDPQGTLLTREQRVERAFQLVWMASTLLLIEYGWTLHAQPGSMYLQNGEERLVPAEFLQKLRLGKMTPKEWAEWCDRFQVGRALLNSALRS